MSILESYSLMLKGLEKPWRAAKVIVKDEEETDEFLSKISCNGYVECKVTDLS